MRPNIGIGDLSMFLERDEDAKDPVLLAEFCGVYDELHQILDEHLPGSRWREPEHVPSEDYEGHVDELGRAGLRALIDIGHEVLGGPSRSHFVALMHGTFAVPLELEAPIALAANHRLGDWLASSVGVLREMQRLQPLVGGSFDERWTWRSIRDDAVSNWNIVYFAARDSVRYGSAIRVG